MCVSYTNSNNSKICVTNRNIHKIRARVQPTKKHEHSRKELRFNSRPLFLPRTT
ncbi:hypothetical protein LguiB_008788 [Lonicera macranthoides]